jgi:UDP-glucose 4-epimerase
MTARLLCADEQNHFILGVDERKCEHLDLGPQVTLKRVKYSRSRLEKLFRSHSFDAVYHLGRMSHTNNSQSRLRKRLMNNILGTQYMLDYGLQYGVKKFIVLSTFHVYGATADNPVFLSENSPLKASLNYSELRDVVEMDRLSTSWMWQHQKEVQTILLRPCNIIGPSLRNAMTNYLLSPYAPVPVDFDPRFQFIHEFDMAQVLRECLQGVNSGVYNVAPDGHISLREAKKLAGVEGLPMPVFLLKWLSAVVNKSGGFAPDYLLDYLKYSCLIDNQQLKAQIGEHFWRFDIEQTLRMLQSHDET